MAKNTGPRPDFQIEVRRDVQGDEDMFLVTPLNHQAINYARVNLATYAMWGQSYLVGPKKLPSVRHDLIHRGRFVIS